MSTPWEAIQAPRRRAILKILSLRERSAGEIHARMTDVTFGAVSQHLAVLREAGLVDVRRAGRYRYYRARPEALGPVASWLVSMWGDSLGELKALAEMEQRGATRRSNDDRRRR